jgi:hypothetical protein
MDFSEFISALIEGFHNAGRKGGVVALLLGIIVTAGGVSLVREAKLDPLHHNAEMSALVLVVGGLIVAGGLSLIATGGSSRRTSGRRHASEEVFAEVPFPYSLCLSCPRVVKSWSATACTRCGSDLVEIRNDEDEHWAREELATRERLPEGNGGS